VNTQHITGRGRGKGSRERGLTGVSLFTLRFIIGRDKADKEGKYSSVLLSYTSIVMYYLNIKYIKADENSDSRR
jgi:hypothetical protein